MPDFAKQEFYIIQLVHGLIGLNKNYHFQFWSFSQFWHFSFHRYHNSINGCKWRKVKCIVSLKSTTPVWSECKKQQWSFVSDVTYRNLAKKDLDIPSFISFVIFHSVEAIKYSTIKSINKEIFAFSIFDCCIFFEF